MKKTLIFGIISILLISMLLIGCTPKQNTPDITTPNETITPPSELTQELPISSRNFKIGTAGFIPPHYPKPQDADWQVLPQTVKEYGELYGVHTGWNENLNEGIPQIIPIAYQFTQGSNTKPYIAIGVEPDTLSQSEADNYFAKNGKEFKNTAVKIAQTHKPDLIILGIEINRFYEKSPTGYNEFVKIYQETYAAIKEVSPDTKVASNFQLEYMKGGGKLTGNKHTTHWEAVSMLGDKQDIATFTSYPYLDYNNPEDIPEDYYTEISKYTSKPIMITETGWPTEKLQTIQASEDSQVTYLKILLDRTQSLDLYGIVWAFPYDINLGIAGGAFDSISLKANNGNSKKAWDYWMALKSLN